MIDWYTKMKNLLSWRWNPDAIVFNSSHLYGTPSYWMQRFFAESSGATLLDTTLDANSASSLIASSIIWKNDKNNNHYLRIKVCMNILICFHLYIIIQKRLLNFSLNLGIFSHSFTRLDVITSFYGSSNGANNVIYVQFFN